MELPRTVKTFTFTGDYFKIQSLREKEQLVI